MTKENLIVTRMGGENLLVHQVSTGGGLNLSYLEALELIKLLVERILQEEDEE